MLFALYVAYEVRSDSEERLLREIEPYADRVDRLFISTIHNTIYQISYIAKQISLEDANASHIQQLLHSFDTNSDDDTDNTELITTQFLWFDVQDMVTYSSAYPSLTPYDIPLRNYIVEAKDKPFRVQIGKVHLLEDPVSKKSQSILPMAMGVANTKRVYQGAVLGYIPVREIGLKICHSLRNPDIDFIVFDGDYNAVVKSCKGETLADQPALIKSLRLAIEKTRRDGDTRSTHLFMWKKQVLAYKISNHGEFSVIVARGG